MKWAIKIVFILNVALAIFSFFVAVSHFNNGDTLHYILGSILILLAISQFFLQRIHLFKYVVIATVISIAVFWIIAIIDFYA